MNKEKKFYNIKEIKEKSKTQKRLSTLNYLMKTQYNITLGEYNRLFEHQQGKCCICNRTQQKRLAVDHNHSTGKVRGLLCNSCNVAIGMLKEDTEILTNAINYLNNTEWFYPDRFVYSDKQS